MRGRAPAAALLALLAGCHRAPSFDERYAAAEHAILASAASIDRELAARQSEGVAADALATGAPPGAAAAAAR